MLLASGAGDSFRFFLDTIKGIGVNDLRPAAFGGVKSLTLMPYSGRIIERNWLKLTKTGII